MSKSVPEVVAHRGYALRYPENTLPALEAAVGAGARYVELDVQLSADGVPVVIHDETLVRTAGREGRVTELTAAELARVRVGEVQRLGPEFSDTPLPSLAQVAQWLTAHLQVTAFVEIKRQSLQRFGTDAVLAAVVRGIAPVRERCVPISFDTSLVRAARAQGRRAGWVLPEWSRAAHALARDLAPEFLFCDRELLPKDEEPLWRGTWRWVVYEVEDVSEALALARRGVDMIETMAVAELLAALRGEARA